MTNETNQILDTPVEDRTPEQTETLRRNLRRVARALHREAWILLSLVREAPQAAIRIEGTDRFAVNPSTKKSHEFCNADLRPLIQTGAVQVEALGNGVALLTVTPTGYYCNLHR